jgi:hypothetical protein
MFRCQAAFKPVDFATGKGHGTNSVYARYAMMQTFFTGRFASGWVSRSIVMTIQSKRAYGP